MQALCSHRTACPSAAASMGCSGCGWAHCTRGMQPPAPCCQIVSAVLAGRRLVVPPAEGLPGGGADLAGLDAYVALLQRCWAQEPQERPTFEDIIPELRCGAKRWPRVRRPMLACKRGAKLWRRALTDVKWHKVGGAGEDPARIPSSELELPGVACICPRPAPPPPRALLRQAAGADRGELQPRTSTGAAGAIGSLEGV